MAKVKYFFDNGKDIGLKADIARHRREEIKLRKRLMELENEPERQEIVISAYKNILQQLLLSKAEVVQKIGEKES